MRSGESMPSTPRHIVTTFRITAPQWEWLRRTAFERSIARAGGRADASEVVRELLDRAMREAGTPTG